MDEVKYLKFAASFMIALILGLPFYISTTYASLSVTVKNSQDVQNFVKSDDFLVFDAAVSIVDDTDITPDQVVLGSTGTFDSCSIGINGFVCTYRFPASETTSFTQSFPYTVNLFQDDRSIPPESVSGTVELDANPPTVTSFSISPPRTTGSVDFAYTITDTANSQSSLCSGISQIEFYQDSFSGTILATETIDTTQCSHSGTTNFQSGISSGTIRVCAKAYDKLGQSSTSLVCDTFEVDKAAPQVVQSSFNILDSNNNPIGFLSSREISANVVVNIRGNDLDKNSVFGDFTEFNPAVSQTNLKAVCGPTVNDETTCRWTVRLKLTQSGSKSVALTFADTLANSGTGTVSHSFQVDTTGPVVTSIVTDKVVAGESYATSQGTNFIANFVETGSGLSSGNVKLHLDGSVFTSNSCTGTTCNWNNVNVPQQTGTITASIGSDTTDRAGNAVATEFTAQIAVDSVNPRITSIEPKSEFPNSEEPLVINITIIEEETTPVVYADFSEISTDEEEVRGTCEERQEAGRPDYWLCQLTVNNLNSAFTQANIEIFAEDSAGNTNSRTHRFTIFEADTDTVPNFVTVTVTENVPQKISRKVISQVKLPLFTLIDIEHGSATILDKSVTCQDTRLFNNDNIFPDNNIIVGTAYLLNKDTDTPHIVLNVKGDTQDLQAATDIGVNCTLRLSIKNGRKIYLIPEEEEIFVKVELFDASAGTISDSLQERLDGSIEHINNLQDGIDTLEDWNRVLSLICSIVLIMAQIDSAMQAFFTTLTVFACAVPLFGNAVFGATCGTFNGFHTFVRNFIWDPGAIPTGIGVGYVFKWVCTIYSCRLADPAFLGQLSTSIAISGIGKGFGVEYEAASEQSGTPILFTGVPRVAGPQDRTTSQKIASLVERPKITGAQTATPSSGWGASLKRTTIDTSISPTQFIWDPYKSIHYARGTLCLPGIIYNMKKEKQINCMQAKCLQENAAQGISIQRCDVALKERQCLYVDSAQYKLHGWMGDVWDRLKEALFGNWARSFLTVMGTVCSVWDQTSVAAECAAGTGSPCSALAIFRPCGLLSTAQSILSVRDVIDNGFNFDTFNAELEGTDFCEGLDLET